MMKSKLISKCLAIAVIIIVMACMLYGVIYKVIDIKPIGGNQIEIEYGTFMNDYSSFFSDDILCKDTAPSNEIGFYDLECTKKGIPFFKKSIYVVIIDSQNPILSFHSQDVITDSINYDVRNNIDKAYDIVDGDIINYIHVDYEGFEGIYTELHQLNAQWSQRSFKIRNGKVIKQNDMIISDEYRNSIVYAEEKINDKESLIHVMCVDNNFLTALDMFHITYTQ